MKKIFSAWFLSNFILIAIVMVAGCSSKGKGTKNLLDFIEDRVTTLDDIYNKLNEPHNVYKNNKILSYQIDQGEEGYFLLEKNSKKWRGRYSLIIIINDKKIVEKHALIDVKPK